MLSTGDNEAATSSAKVVATVTDLGTNNTLDIQFTEPLALVEGNNWLRVRYDTKEDAEADTNSMQYLLHSTSVQQSKILLMEILQANVL